MPFTPFHKYFPAIAEHETRTITVVDSKRWNLPAAHYTLHEMYCDEPGCDCRRVFFSVVSSLTKDVMAVIAYGWESRKFYAQWLGDNDRTMIKELQGPVLNLWSEQSELATVILEMVKKTALQDSAYIERIKIHYQMFREKVERKKSLWWKIRKKKRGI